MSRPAIPVVIDTDVGTDVDDAFALLFALASPEVNLVGVSVTDGDVELRSRLAARLLGMAGRADVPVFKGLGEPIGPGRGPTMLGHEGRGILDVAYDGPEATVRETPAVEWLIEESRRGKFHLIGIGPYQTIATAFREDPTLYERLLGLTVMGGVFNEGGFPAGYQRAFEETGLPPAWIDHNAQSDPEAALICARSGVPMTWVTGEVTLRAPMSRAAGNRIKGLGDPLGASLSRMLTVWYEEWFGGWLPGYEGPPPDPEDSIAYHHDALAVYSVFTERHAERWLELREVRVDYGLEDHLFRMRPNASQGETTVKVTTGVDTFSFEELLISRIETSFGASA